MIFIYSEKAGEKELKLEGESFTHIFKARRTQLGEILELRNLKDNFSYFYKVVEVKKKEAVLELQEKKEKPQKNKKNFHLLWCVVDIKTIKEALPYLNQVGVSKISFLYCERSQKSFKINLEKLEKILIQSSEQCGRWGLMKLGVYKSLEDFQKKNDEEIFLLDFGGRKISDLDMKKKEKITTVLVGPEGGISKKEREKFSSEKIISFDTDLVLKSETACVSLASKILL